ncbi:hypothetical protein J2R98_001150 [Alkalibacillus filiformis]|uniref:Phage capsid protein n=1 Tax=Alkalibacillus filiformis TaxID=200990 RepID=A0ABU0DSB3_9BACI|nr:DUF6366 family protein [Alkalibacillus filiformis]MDQ0351336.1 hypothetical protein [Alkalibacillus filiformis]
MSRNQESPEERQERMRQEELRNNPGGNLSDSLNRASHGSAADLASGLGWKGTGILIIVLVVAFFAYALFFN